MDDKLARELMGLQDARGPRGIMSRGKNIYMGASHAPRTGSKADVGNPLVPSYKNMKKEAIARRLLKVRRGGLNRPQLQGGFPDYG